MTKLPDPRVPARFVPPDEERRAIERRRAYLFRVPTTADQAAFARAVSVAGGRRVPQLHLLQIAAAGIREIMPDAEDGERQALLAELDGFRADLAAFGAYVQALDPDETAEADELIARHQAAYARAGRADEILATVARHYRPMAEARADNESFALIAGTEAARLFLVGWENGPFDLTRGMAGVGEECLAAIPRYHRAAFLDFVEGLMTPGAAAAKNSASPPGGSPDGTTSQAARKPRPGRRSTATPGSATPSASG